MSGTGLEAASRNASAQMEPAIKAPLPERDSPHSQPEEKDEPPALTPAKSEIQLPAVAPSPTPVTTPAPRPSITPLPKPSPKPTAKPSPKPSPKKIAEAKATPRPSPKKSTTPSPPDKKAGEARKEAVKVAPAKVEDVGEKSGSTGPGGGVRASEFSWYGKMLHDRFYSEWIQPTTSVAVGAKMSALVRIRIETDGRISKFTLVRPSGNVVVDESVAAVAKRVTQVDPLPKGLAGGSFYEVNVNFELNPEQ